MVKASAEVIATCPNLVCGVPIYADHDSSSCTECGGLLPDNIQEHLPLLRDSSERAEAVRSSPLKPIAVGAASLTHRYRDAYSVARVIVGVGSGVKVLGVIMGILLALASFGAQGTLVVMGLMAALVAGAFFFVAGVMISAQGQLLQATLDTAVNTSPLLDNEQKSQILA